MCDYITFEGTGKEKNVIDGNAHTQGAVIPSMVGEWEIFHPDMERLSLEIVAVLLQSIFKQRHC